MADYDNPRPSSQPEGSTEMVVVKDNLITLDLIAVSTDPTVTNRKGEIRKTFAGMDDAADAVILDIETRGDAALGALGGVHIGEYSTDPLITERNQYVTFGVSPTATQWKITDSTSLNYQIDSTTYPDPENDPSLIMFNDVTQEFVNQNFDKFGTLSSFVNDPNLAIGMAVRVTDRADGIFNVVLASAVTPNTFNIVQCVGAPTLALVLQNTQFSGVWDIETVVNVKQWGAVGDGSTDDQPPIQAACDYATNNFVADPAFLQNYRAAEYDQSIGLEVFLPTPKVAYSFDSSLNIKGIISIRGAGSFNTVLRKGASFSDPSNAILNISRADEVDELWILGGTFKGFKVNGVDNSIIGILQVRHHFYKFEDVVVSECLQGCLNKGGYTGKYDSCQFMANNVGFKAELYDPAGPIFEEPNNIDFVSCVMLENLQGWNIGGATNFNFVGGLTQGHENEGLTTNGIVGAVSFSGHYFETNANTGGHQIETPFSIRSLRIEGGQISTTFDFLDAEKVNELVIKGNNILGANTMVFISPTSTIRSLSYKNNPRIFATAMTKAIIDNSKVGFVPDPLNWVDFATSTAGAFASLNQIKLAFNGTKGTFIFTEDTDTPMGIDFPCTVTATSKDIGVSRGDVNAVTVLSSDVDFVGMKLKSTGSFTPLTVGDSVNPYKGIRVKQCLLSTGSASLGPVNSLALADFVSVVDCDIERTVSNGESVTFNGDSCLAMNLIQKGAFTNRVVYTALSTNSRWALIDGTILDQGTGNSSM